MDFIISKIVSILYFLCHHNKYINAIIHKLLKYHNDAIIRTWNDRLIDCSIQDIEWKQKKMTVHDSFYIKDKNSPDIQGLLNNDESWWEGRLFNRGKFLAEFAPEPTYSYECGMDNFTVHTPDIADSWVYLSSKKKLPLKYAFEFDFTSYTEISEHLQIDLFAHSLSRRIQIILSYNKEIIINAVDHSIFMLRLFSMPFSMPLGRPSKIRIIVINNTFRLEIDHKNIFSKKIIGYNCVPSRFFILFWNQDKKTEIHNSIANFKYYESV